MHHFLFDEVQVLKLISMVGLQQFQDALESPTSFLFSVFTCDFSAEKVQILNSSKGPWHLEGEKTEYVSRFPELPVTMWSFQQGATLRLAVGTAPSARSRNNGNIFYFPSI